MKHSEPVGKIECDFFDKKGMWQLRATMKLKKGCEWEIPLASKSMKKFLLNKFPGDRKKLAKGGFIVYRFPHLTGFCSCLITSAEKLHKLKIYVN